jgi:hypothetical protein
MKSCSDRRDNSVDEFAIGMRQLLQIADLATQVLVEFVV